MTCTIMPADTSIDPRPASAGKNAISMPICTSCSTSIPSRASTYSSLYVLLAGTGSSKETKMY